MASASHCNPFSASLAALKRERRHTASASAARLAVCLTGQLRLFMVGFPTLVRNLLLPAATRSRIDFFYVGPADLSYARGKAYLLNIPGLKATTLYDPQLVWRSLQDASPIVQLAPGTGFNGGNKSRVRRSVAQFNLRGLEGCPGPLRSRLVQALQSRECLRLIERAETSELPAVHQNRSSLRLRHRYAAVLRVRADALTLQPTELPVPHAHAPLPLYSSLHECVRGRLAPHDYLLHGSRDVMGVVLGALDGTRASALVRSSCDVHMLAAQRLARALPSARCVVPKNRTPVASVRGSVSGGCYFLDQEHPPNDGEPQPRLREVFVGAGAVAGECLGLRERRDGRRPGVGAACEPRGGWDGDFRDDASPWDSATTAPNRGAG